MQRFEVFLLPGIFYDMVMLYMLATQADIISFLYTRTDATNIRILQGRILLAEYEGHMPGISEVKTKNSTRDDKL